MKKIRKKKVNAAFKKGKENQRSKIKREKNKII